MVGKFKDSWVASLTLFSEDGALDGTALASHFVRLAAAGQNIYAASTNIGEGFSMTDDEVHRVLSIAVKATKNRVGIRAGGREARSAAEALAMVKLAEDAGVEAVHVFQLDVGHASSKPDVRELEHYYYSILDQSELPVVLSNYPKMGYSVPLDLVSRLTDRYQQVIGLRDTSGDAAYFSEAVARFSGRLELSSVGPRFMLNSLFLGADAVMTTEANVAPGLVSDVLRAFQCGDFATLTSSFANLVSLHLLLSRYGGSGGRGMKPLLHALGMPAGPLRPPRQPISYEETQSLIEAVRLLDLPELRAASAM